MSIFYRDLEDKLTPPIASLDDLSLNQSIGIWIVRKDGEAMWNDLVSKVNSTGTKGIILFNIKELQEMGDYIQSNTSAK